MREFIIITKLLYLYEFIVFNGDRGRPLQLNYPYYTATTVLSIFKKRSIYERY